MWEKQPLVIARRDPLFYRDLLSFADVDRVLTTLYLRFPEIRLAKRDDPPKADTYTFADGRIDPLAVTKLFGEGVTVVFDQQQRRIPALADLCRDLEREVGASFQTNLYLTPPGGGGFKVHYDTHDVFVLQIAGRKTWELFASPIELPMSGQQHDVPGTPPPGEVMHRFTLAAGDIAYIPRGIYHQALVGDALSLHVTLGAMVKTWSELMLEAVAEIALRDVDFRKALPVGFGTGDFDRAEAQRIFQLLAARLATSLDFDAAAKSLTDDFLRARDSRLNGQLEQVAQLVELTADSVIVARPSRIVRIEREGESIALYHLNSRTEFPAYIEESLRQALSGAALRVTDIAGDLDSDGKLTLARRLIREGLLTIVN